MAERLYRVRNPDGTELEPASPDDVCELISLGEIDLEAVAAADGDDAYLPITQFTLFAKAFEARFGIGSRPMGSDSTPRSPSKLEPQTKTFFPAVPLLELATRTPPEPRDGLGFASQEPNEWTPISASNVEPPPLDTKIDPIPTAPRHDEDPPTPITRTSPALEAINTADIEPETPVTQSGVATDVDLPVQVIVGEPVPKARLISEIMRPSPVVIAVPPQLISIEKRDPAASIVPLLPDRTAASMAYALAAWAVLFLVFYGGGIALALGSEEARWIPNGYYWARILLLVSAGIGLSTMLLKDELVGPSRFMVSAKWTGIAVAIGLVAGLLGPAQKFGAGLPVALAMGFLQVVSEEVFFRGYVDRALLRSVPGVMIPTAIAAVMYGCFQLTYGTLWLDRSLPEVLLHGALAIVLLGVPLSYLHHKTRGFVAPFVCHVVAMMAMLIGAF